MKIKLKIKNLWSRFTGHWKRIIEENSLKSNLILYLALPFMITLILESFERKFIFGGVIFLATHPYRFFVNMLVIVLTFSVTLLLRKRVFWVTALTCIWLALGIANFVLLCNRVTPFTSCDLFMIESLFPMMQKYFNNFQITVIIALIGLVVVALILFFFKAPKLPGKIRYVRSLFLIIATFGLTVGSAKIGIRTGILEDQFREISQSYLRNGFVYCLTNSVIDMGVSKPKDYTDEQIKTFVNENKASVTDTEIATKPNIIIVQLESFFNLNSLKGVTFSQSPIPNFEALQKEGAGGKLDVPVVGAGTVNSEFEVITGMNIDDFGPGEYPYKTILREKTSESLANNLKPYGYKSHVIHNNTGGFYSRNVVYGNLGFDDFTSVEYMNDYDKTPTGWAKDACLSRYIMQCLDSSEGQDLVSAISVQGHGSYFLDAPYEKHISILKTPNEETKTAVEYYANLLYEMDLFIGDLIQKVKDRGEDTIVVMYGDHLPSLNFTEDELTDRNIYQTDYFIWNNMGLKFDSKELEAYNLTTDINKTLGIKNGVINMYHQNHGEDKDFTKGLATLEYDLLYGDLYAFDGVSPYKPIEMQMGLEPISIQNIVSGVMGDKFTYVQGKNFTPYSRVYVNDEKQSTTFINSSTLKIDYENLGSEDTVCVWQSKLTSTPKYRYNTVLLSAPD